MFNCSSWKKNCDKNKLNTISLSTGKAAPRVQDTGNKTNRQFKTRQMISNGFSLALDELADVTNTAQLLFMERVTGRFEGAGRFQLYE